MKPWNPLQLPAPVSQDSILKFGGRFREFLEKEIQAMVTANQIPLENAQGAVFGAILGHIVGDVGIRFVRIVSEQVETAFIDSMKDQAKGRPLS